MQQALFTALRGSACSWEAKESEREVLAFLRDACGCACLYQLDGRACKPTYPVSCLTRSVRLSMLRSPMYPCQKAFCLVSSAAVRPEGCFALPEAGTWHHLLCCSCMAQSRGVRDNA